MMEHFIITRFNLKKTDWKTDSSSAFVLDENWLKERIELFLDFCLPSVVNQTSDSFKWLIFFEKDSREQLGRLPKQLKAWDFIEPIFVKGYEEFQNRLPSLILDRIGQTSQEIITTRLDNDDALHKDFVKNIKEILSLEAPDSVLHFPYGFCLQLGKKNKLALQYYPLNQFLSLKEKVGQGKPPITVYANEHNRWAENFRVLSGGNDPRWLQIIHERNMKNRFEGKLVFKKHIKNFPIRNQDFPWNYDLKLAIERLAKKAGI